MFKCCRNQYQEPEDDWDGDENECYTIECTYKKDKFAKINILDNLQITGKYNMKGGSMF